MSMPDVTPPAGPALDAEVARAVFNRPIRIVTHRGRPRTVYADVELDDPQEWHWFQAEIESYSTSFTDAFKVVARMRELGHTKWQLDGDQDGCAALFSAQRAGMTCTHSSVDSCCCCWEWVQATAPTAPEAICRAALRALALEATHAGDGG